MDPGQTHTLVILRHRSYFDGIDLLSDLPTSANSSLASLLPLIISAPFGNYIQPTGATPTLGTFTALPRSGRVWRILKTVRYHPRLKAWTNKIGLRNPGIDFLIRKSQKRPNAVKQSIVSIHGFTPEDWETLLNKMNGVKCAAVELNMSCPNVGEIDWPTELFTQAMAGPNPVIVKLPPVNYQAMAQQAWDAGVRMFHACNTLPVPAGGLSGKPLMPVSLQCIGQLKQIFGDDIHIIGGGGITKTSDIDAYVNAGVQHVAIGTKTMNPWLLASKASLIPLIEHAQQRLG